MAVPTQECVLDDLLMHLLMTLRRAAGQYVDALHQAPQRLLQPRNERLARAHERDCMDVACEAAVVGRGRCDAPVQLVRRTIQADIQYLLGRMRRRTGSLQVPSVPDFLVYSAEIFGPNLISSYDDPGRARALAPGPPAESLMALREMRQGTREQYTRIPMDCGRGAGAARNAQQTQMSQRASRL